MDLQRIWDYDDELLLWKYIYMEIILVIIKITLISVCAAAACIIKSPPEL